MATNPQRLPAVKIDDELVWYFCDAAAALGLRAARWSPAPVHTLDVASFGVSPQQQAQARRYRAIAEALAALTDDQQKLLARAYEPRKGWVPRVGGEDGRELEVKHGLAAGVIRAEKGRRAPALAAAAELVAAREAEEQATLALARNPALPTAWRPVVGIALLEVKTALSAARTTAREAKEAADAAERDGVRLLEEAHRAFRAARRAQRAAAKAEAAEARKNEAPPRARLRAAEKVVSGRRERVGAVARNLQAIREMLRAQARLSLEAFGVEAAE